MTENADRANVLAYRAENMAEAVTDYQDPDQVDRRAKAGLIIANAAIARALLEVADAIRQRRE